MTSDEPQDELMGEDSIIWAKSNDADKVRKFSAVCLLTAKYMADVLGKEKVIIYEKCNNEIRKKNPIAF